jgi:hypothetical protein
MRGIRIFVIVFFAGVLAAWGCGGDDPAGPDTTKDDSISIKSVTPDSGLNAGVATNFVVAVEYELASADSGELNVGFNTMEVGRYVVIVDAKAYVSMGSGEHQFSVTAIPIDWGPAGDFEAYVNLSEHPHGQTWTPLATDRLALAF